MQLILSWPGTYANADAAVAVVAPIRYENRGQEGPPTPTSKPTLLEDRAGSNIAI